MESRQWKLIRASSKKVKAAEQIEVLQKEHRKPTGVRPLKTSAANEDLDEVCSELISEGKKVSVSFQAGTMRGAAKEQIHRQALAWIKGFEANLSP